MNSRYRLYRNKKKMFFILLVNINNLEGQYKSNLLLYTLHITYFMNFCQCKIIFINEYIAIVGLFGIKLYL